MNNRLTWFDSQGRVERTTTLAETRVGYDVFPLPGDSVLLSGYSLAPELVGVSVHVFSPEGERIRSFGEATHPITSQSELEHVKHLALERDGGLWIASWDRYLIEHWSLEGDRLASFVRDVDWFDDPSPPRALLPSVRQDRSGLLWVQVLVPASSGSGHETIIEAVDPRAGQVLASRRLDGQQSNLFDGSRLACVVLDLEREMVQLIVLQMRVGRAARPAGAPDPLEGGDR